jgi:hypothetical protein
MEAPGHEGLEVLTSRTGLAIGCFLIFSLGLYFGTRLIQGKPLHLPAPRYFPSSAEKPLSGGPLPTAATRHLEPPVELRTTVQPIEAPRPAADATGIAAEPLEGLFRSLRRTESRESGAITRVCHWGDSQIVADNITSTLRRRFQLRFGDSGHGFVSVGRPSSYLHRDVWHWDRDWSFAGVAQAGFPDRMFGLGGMMSFASNARAMARLATRESYPVGKRMSRVEVGFLVHPEGGRFKVLVDDKDVGTVDTRWGRHDKALLLPEAPEGAVGEAPGDPKERQAAPNRADGVFSRSFEDGPHEVTIRALGFGIVRLHGAVLERDQPGVVYDSLGLKGAQLHDLARLEPAHFARQLRWRSPALLVFGFGTNESYQSIPMDEYIPKWRLVLARARAAMPGASCLVLGPVDRVYKRRQVHPRTVPLTKALREAALGSGCAFWDTYEAMGGGNAALTYRRAGLLYGDLAHLNPDGGERLGKLLFTAIMERYDHWKAEQKRLEKQAGQPPLPEARPAQPREPARAP